MAASSGLGRFAGAIPLAVLAGVLLKSGWDIIDWKYILRARALSKSSVLIMVNYTSLFEQVRQFQPLPMTAPKCEAKLLD